MHEIGIANSIVEAVREEMKLYPCGIARRVTVRIGELAAVDPDALRFGFDAITRETELESLELEIELCLRMHRCEPCDFEFPVKEFDYRCPRCKNEDTQCIGGQQLELAHLELEAHEPSSA